MHFFQQNLTESCRQRDPHVWKLSQGLGLLAKSLKEIDERLLRIERQMAPASQPRQRKETLDRRAGRLLTRPVSVLQRPHAPLLSTFSPPHFFSGATWLYTCEPSSQPEFSQIYFPRVHGTRWSLLFREISRFGKPGVRAADTNGALGLMGFCDLPIFPWVRGKGVCYGHFHLQFALHRVVSRCELFLDFGGCSNSTTNPEQYRGHGDAHPVGTGISTLQPGTAGLSDRYQS